MSTDDTRPGLAPLPSAAEIVRYMRSAGWTHGRQGSHGAMWTKGDVEFSVPHEDHDPSWLREVVGRLASAEGRTPEETAAAIAEHKAAPLVMPADEFAAVGTVAEACGSTADADALEVTSPAPAPGGRPGTATGPAGEDLGRLVHSVRLASEAERAEEEGRQRFRLGEWEERTPWQRALDMRIGHAVANYALTENAITWNTDCTSCARILDSAVAERERAEQAEAKLAVITTWARRGGVVDSTAILAVVAAETPAELAELDTEGAADHA